MGDETRSASIIGSVGVVWLISLLVGLPAVPPGKPAAPLLPKAESASQAKVSYSRLWDDPLESTGAIGYIQYKGTIKQAQRGTRVKWTGKATPPESAGVTKAVFVFVRGLRFAELTEGRRQQRYAVQAAFWSKGLSPLRGDKLASLDIPFPHVFGEGPEPFEVRHGEDYALRVPYEDFVDQTGRRSDIVRVCYINLDLLDARPLLCTYRIAAAFGLQDKPIAATSPPTTDWLKCMLAEASVVTNAETAKAKFAVFNSMATAALPEFADVGPTGPQRATHIEIETQGMWGANRLPVAIHQMIEPDNGAIRLILEELGLRRAGVGGNDWLWGYPSSVVVLSERETGFGQLFATNLVYEHVRRQNEARAKLGLEPIDLDAPDGREHQAVLSFAYLRGLDGLPPEVRASGQAPEMPVKRSSAAEPRNPGEALSRTFEPAPLPRPYGPSQFDYVARLGERLKRIDSERRASGRGEIRAFVIIGTDVDDKLALLKVLRPRFPNAYFFTNEMDAEFVQPENAQYTRNLIVATRYDLDGYADPDVSPQLQELPSFRTSSQRAMVDSVWGALDWIGAAKRAKCDKQEIRPVRLYEAGLRRWHRLTTSVDTAERGGCRPQQPSKLEVLRNARLGFSPMGLIALIAVLLTLLSAGLARRAAQPDVPKRSVAKRIRRWWRKLRACWRWLFTQKGAKTKGEACAAGDDPVLRWCWRLTHPAQWLLIGKKEAFPAYVLRELHGGQRRSVPDPNPDNNSKFVNSWWVYGFVVAFGSCVWWAIPIRQAGVGVGVCAMAAIAWICLPPRPDQKLVAGTLLVCGVLPLICWIAGVVLSQTYRGEPWAWADGVCLWPGVLLRAIAVLLALRFVNLAWEDLRALRDRLIRRFFLEREGGIPGGVRHGEPLAAWKPGEHHSALIARGFPKRSDLDQGSNPDAETKVQIEENEPAEWIAYLDSADPRRPEVRVRIVRLTFALLSLCAALMFVVGLPNANARGWVAMTADLCSLAAAVVCLTFLAVFVGEQFMRARKFIRSIWPHGASGYGFEMEECLLLVARLTGGVGNLLPYPFTVCFILLCAYSAHFEHWRHLTGLYAVLGLPLLALVILTWRMQSMARRVRAQTLSYLQLTLAEAVWMKRLILQRLDFPPKTEAPSRESWWRYTVTRLGRHLTLPELPRTLVKLDCSETSRDDGCLKLDGDLDRARKADVDFYDARIARIEQLIQLVKDIKEGAFGGFSESPIVRGVLIPGAGLGSIELIQRVVFG